MVEEIRNAALFHGRIPARPYLQGRASAGRCCLPPKFRGTVVKRGVSPPSPSTPMFSARTAGTAGLRLGFKVATGAEEGPGAEPRLARDAFGAHAPATQTSRSGVWSQAAAAPPRPPRDLA